jgi:hypothetical protein
MRAATEVPLAGEERTRHEEAEPSETYGTCGFCRCGGRTYERNGGTRSADGSVFRYSAAAFLLWPCDDHADDRDGYGHPNTRGYRHHRLIRSVSKRTLHRRTPCRDGGAPA